MMKLTVPEPCSEDYFKMSSAERGRFCSSCKKEVIDFTVLSEYQILEIFRNNNSKMCGRINPDQLEKDYKTATSGGKKSTWVAALFSTLMVLSSSTSKGAITNHVLPKIQLDLSARRVTDGRTPAQKDSVKLLKGRVVDDKGEGLPGASIQIKGTSIKAVATTDGRFEINIPVNTRLSEAELQVNFIGFIPLFKNLKGYKDDEQLVMSLHPALLGEVALVGGVICKKPTLWSRFIGLFK